jgi:hypothetical protein
VIVLFIIFVFAVGFALGAGFAWYVRGAHLPTSKRFAELFVAKEEAHASEVRRLLEIYEKMKLRIAELEREGR